jgi:hypothetical protein
MLGKLLSEKRVLICTFVALASGFFGSYLGGQISWLARTEQCRNQPEGLDHLCRAWQTPGALLKGSTAGAWTGTILGAFFAGLATRDPEKKELNSQGSNPENPLSDIKPHPTLAELSPDEIATLRRILRSLLESEKKSRSNQPTVEPNPSSNCSDSSSTTIAVTQFIDWIHLLGQQSETSPILTHNKAREILIYLGYPQPDIDTSWQQLNRKN